MTNVTRHSAGHAPAHVVFVDLGAGALGRPVAVVAGQPRTAGRHR
jgi:hypothetical protein